jgi:hypothetical protein
MIERLGCLAVLSLVATLAGCAYPIRNEAVVDTSPPAYEGRASRPANCRTRWWLSRRRAVARGRRCSRCRCYGRWTRSSLPRAAASPTRSTSPRRCRAAASRPAISRSTGWRACRPCPPGDPCQPPGRCMAVGDDRRSARHQPDLAFNYVYAHMFGLAPAEADMQRHFRVSPPSVHQMVLGLERDGLIRRRPGAARSIDILVPRQDLPILDWLHINSSKPL